MSGFQKDLISHNIQTMFNLKGNVTPCPFSKRNPLHYVYWQTGLIMGLLSLGTGILIIVMDKRYENSIFKFYYIYNMIKGSLLGTFIPIFFYPARYWYIQNYILMRTFWKNRQLFNICVDMCTLIMTIINISEIFVLLYCYRFIKSEYDFNQFDPILIAVFMLQILVILVQWFMIWYRFITPVRTFWLALYGDSKTPKPKHGELYKYQITWFLDRWNDTGLIGIWYKTLVLLYQIVFRPIYYLVTIFALVFFLSMVAITMLLSVIWFILDIYFVSLIFYCYCKEKRRKKILNCKRYSYIGDYLLFQIVLNTFHLDKVFAYFVQTRPYKDLLNPLILIFFQHRFVNQFLRQNTIPKYNLWWDYTTSRVLDDYGRTTYTRWMPGIDAKIIRDLPPIEKVVQLFKRKDNSKYIVEDNMQLSMLFAFYVRFFTHQFTNTNVIDGELPNQMRTDRKLKYWDTVNNPSMFTLIIYYFIIIYCLVGLNLSALYGSSRRDTDEFRKFKGGLLKYIEINGYEYPEIRVCNENIRKAQFRVKKGTKYFHIPNWVEHVHDLVWIYKCTNWDNINT